MDLSDPYTFLWLKRGVHRTYNTSLLSEYVQFKPILAVLTVLLKILGKYQDGRLDVQNGYTWIALFYSTCTYLYKMSLYLSHCMLYLYFGSV